MRMERKEKQLPLPGMPERVNRDGLDDKKEELALTVLTGVQSMRKSCCVLLRLLHRLGAPQCGDIQETEALIAWASTAMESPSQNSAQLLQMLKVGLRDLSTITANPLVGEIAFKALAERIPGVSYATVIKRAGKPRKFKVYMSRRQPTY